MRNPRSSTLLFRTFLGLALTGTVACALAQNVPPAADAPPATRPAENPRQRGNPAGVPDNLEAAMKDMGRNFKILKSSATDPAKAADNLKAVSLLERDVTIAKSLLPPEVAKLSGDARKTAETNYRAMMISLLRTSLDLEEAIVDQKADEITKQVTGIGDLMKQGHKEFRKQDD
jgi:hypothetical protein